MAYPTEAQHQQNDAAAMKTHGAAAARWVKQIRANVDAFWDKSISYEAFSANQVKLWNKVDEGGSTLRLAVDFLLRQPAPAPVVYRMIRPSRITLKIALLSRSRRQVASDPGRADGDQGRWQRAADPAQGDSLPQVWSRCDDDRVHLRSNHLPALRQDRRVIFYLGTHEPSWLARAGVPLFISRRRMCEPWIIQKTGLSVLEHQRRTIDSYDTLKNLAPEIPWAPVLQGWTMGDYVDHLDAYEARGFNLRALPVVGLGSVCRRQATIRSSLIVSWLHDEGLKLHGFGMKTQGLPRNGPKLASADSLAWSLDARRSDPLPTCTHSTCSSCLPYALAWRSKVLAA